METPDAVKIIRAQLEGVDRQIEALKSERKVLVSLLDKLSPSNSIAPTVASFFNRPSPREAILDYVVQNPGQTPTEIAKALEGSIDSRATDKRNVLRTTVAKLANDGLLRRDEATNQIFSIVAA